MGPAAASVRAGDFGADRPARKDAFALAHHVAVDLLERADLSAGEAARLVARVAFGRSREAGTAAARVVDQAVLDPVLGIALRVDLFGQQRKLGCGDRAALRAWTLLT